MIGATVEISEEQLLRLIEVCSDCSCDFNCYCSRNMDWAEKRLAKLRKRQAERSAKSSV